MTDANENSSNGNLSTETSTQNANASSSLPNGYFESVYDASEDPWNFETSEYEREKYHATITALPRAMYANALEIGCSIGVLTERLAEFCAHLLALDVSEQALRKARQRCAYLPQVEFRHMRVPDEFPNDEYDLIVVSEVAYYWSTEDLERAQKLIVEQTKTGAHILLVHWTPFVPDYPQTGDAVHESFLRLARDEKNSAEDAGGRACLRHVSGKRAERYRLDLFVRV